MVSYSWKYQLPKGEHNVDMFLHMKISMTEKNYQVKQLIEYKKDMLINQIKFKHLKDP